MRQIPSIDSILNTPRARALAATAGRDAVVAAARAAAGELRQRGDAPDAPATAGDALAWIDARLGALVSQRLAASLRPVINATGVIVHTNLGRAPLAVAALARAASIAEGYSNLEYDLEAGGRGRRDVHAERLLTSLTGAEAAVVVNNNAAAMLVALAALAAGREVVVSRGELVEIGGGFRVPDVLAASGAVLREVGTTNRTRAADYAAAINDRTALLLRVHPSNFRIEGFTERPALEDLASIARRFDVPLVEDAGSGWLGRLDVAGRALADEPVVGESLRRGADLVAFSGDKLVGGPQAGILVGRADLVDRVRRHPLMRAVRADKLTYAALEATLELWLSGRASDSVPLARMLTMTVDEIDRRARAFVAALDRRADVSAEVVDGESTPGGGSAPGSALPTRLIAIACRRISASALEERLRRGDPAVVVRIVNDRVVIDLRTVAERQDDALRIALETAAG